MEAMASSGTATVTLPTDEQIDSAVAGTDWEHREVPVIARSDLAQVIADHSPELNGGSVSSTACSISR